MHVFTTDYIKKLFSDINTNLLRRFNKYLKKDENNKPRDWPAIEEPKIKELFDKVKKEVGVLIEEFKYIKIRWETETPGGDDEIEEEKSPLEKNTFGRSMLGRSQSLMYNRLLSEDQINRVKDKFNEDTDYVLEEAIRKHVSL